LDLLTIHKITDRIGRILEKRKIKMVFKPTRTIRQSLRSAKDKHWTKLVYIGTTKRSVNTRIAEHKRSCRLGQTEKSAVAEHALSRRHDIEEVEVMDHNVTIIY